MTQQLKNYPLLVLVLLPILLLLIDSGWIFAPIGHTDTWLYFGYFVNFPQHLRLFAQTYYSARLSWILLGAAAYNQFSPLVANYVLHLGVYYLAIFPFYFTLKLNFSAKIALVTSILFGTHTLFLRAIGWNYTDGVGLAYVLLTIWMLTCSTKLNRKVIYLFLAGAAFACLIYSNPMWISTTPLLFGYFLFQIYQLRGKRRNRPLSQFIAFGGGVAVVTIAFGMIAFQINGNYLFFLPALQASGALAVGTNQWIVSWTYWLPRAAWLVFPAILLLPSLTVLWQNKRTYDQKQLVAAGQIAFPWTFLGLWIIWLFWELTHHPLLQTQYYMDYLLPFGYLAFGAFLAMRWGEWIERHFHTAAWMLIIAFSGTFALARLLQPIFSSIASYAALIPFVLGTVGMINLAFSWINLRTLVIGILCLSLANVFVYHAATIIQILDEPEITWSTGTPDEYLTIYDAVKAIQKFSPMGNIYFWYNSKDPEPLRSFYRSIASTFTWWPRYVKSDFPRFEDSTIALEDGSIVVVLSAKKGIESSAVQGLSNQGLGSSILSVEVIRQGSQELVMTFIRIIKPISPDEMIL